MVNYWIGAALDFHNILQRVRAGIGTGTASLRVNLPQKLTSIMEEVLYEVFFDLQKSYDTLDRELCMEIIVG